jgi:hypothetical protein
MLEKFLTLSEGDFKMLLRSTPAEDSVEDRDPRREAYRYAMVSLRSESSNTFIMWLTVDTGSYLPILALCYRLFGSLRNTRSPIALSCVLSLTVSILDYQVRACSISKPVLLCQLGWMCLIMR